MPHIPSSTSSICPICHKVIQAKLSPEGNKLWMRKSCPEHGDFEDIYWGDLELLERFLELSHPNASVPDWCPSKCGLCPGHISSTALAIIDVTSRCNLGCPTCFASSGRGSNLPRSDVLDLIDFLMSRDPPPFCIQFSGGEPTLHPDLPEFVEYAKSLGLNHAEVNTNGLKIADADYLKQLRQAGTGAIYLQFDGVSPEPYIKLRGRDIFGIKLEAIRNCRQVGQSIVLVPTVVKGVNDSQLGEILRFGIQNSDVVRCINFQPVSFCGRNDFDPKQHRITIPEVIHGICSQTGFISPSDFFPVPTVDPLIRFFEIKNSRRYPHFSCHPLCGAATYLFLDGNPKPITRLANVNGFLSQISRAGDLLSKGSKFRAYLRMIYSLRYLHPKLMGYLLRILLTGGYGSLAKLHYRMMMIGIMHFMDEYNFDLARVNRCTIHYAIPGSKPKLIPFCSYNTLYRDPLIPSGIRS